MDYSNDSQSKLSNELTKDGFTLSIDIGNLWRGLLLFVATLFSHWQAIGGGFIWDDDAHVTKAALRSLDGLWAIWFKLGATQPVSYTHLTLPTILRV